MEKLFDNDVTALIAPSHDITLAKLITHHIERLNKNNTSALIRPILGTAL